MSVKDRLIEFIGTLGIGQKQFEQNCDISNGSVNNIRNSIGPKNLKKIKLRYPEINELWLLHGQQPMLLQGSYRADTKIKNSKDIDIDMTVTPKDTPDRPDTPPVSESWLTDALIANRESAIANKEAAIANRITAENQRELIQMQKHKSGFNLDEISRIQDEEHTLVSVLQMKLAEFVAKLGLFPSAEDATEEINNAFDAAMAGEKTKSSHHAGDSLSNNEAYL